VQRKQTDHNRCDTLLEHCCLLDDAPSKGFLVNATAGSPWRSQGWPALTSARVATTNSF
jgi:hypothetical protein